MSTKVAGACNNLHNYRENVRFKATVGEQKNIGPKSTRFGAKKMRNLGPKNAEYGTERHETEFYRFAATVRSACGSLNAFNCSSPRSPCLHELLFRP